MSMKNVHKIRGKREFLFDDRELIVLGGGALVICVLIFVLGFLFGQGIQEKSVANPLDTKDALLSSETASTEKEVNVTPVAENKTKEVSAGQKNNQRSYYQELPDSETYIEVEGTPTKKSTPGPAPLEKSQPEKAETPVPQQVIKEEPLSRPSTTPTALPRQEMMVAPALPNVPKSPTDVIQVGRPTRSPEGKTAIPTGTSYAVQVASSPNKEDSERLRQKYVDLGYEADIMTADLAGKGVWYRVLVGNAATKEEAEQLKNDLLTKAGHLSKNPFIIKVNE